MSFRRESFHQRFFAPLKPLGDALSAVIEQNRRPQPPRDRSEVRFEERVEKRMAKNARRAAAARKAGLLP